MNWSNFVLATAANTERNFWLPEQASTAAGGIDAIFYFILYVSAVFFVGIVLATLYLLVKYRRRDRNQRTSAIHGNTRLEITWSVIPTILLLAMFFWGFRGWLDLNVPPGKAMEVRVLARRWSWSFDYPGQDIRGVPELVVPLNKPVKLIMSSTDVIHSLFIPAFRIKKDVIPNRYSVVWFQATQTGTFDLYCTEYCGQEHSRMITRVKVLPDEEFESWVETGGGMKGLSPAELGKKLFTAQGCTACHSITADRENKPGPPMAGKYGSMEALADGSEVEVDDNYIRESIVEPTAKVVAGMHP